MQISSPKTAHAWLKIIIPYYYTNNQYIILRSWKVTDVFGNTKHDLKFMIKHLHQTHVVVYRLTVTINKKNQNLELSYTGTATASSSASTPGSIFPSKSSKLAPPPVEM